MTSVRGGGPSRWGGANGRSDRGRRMLSVDDSAGGKETLRAPGLSTVRRTSVRSHFSRVLAGFGVLAALLLCALSPAQAQSDLTVTKSGPATTAANADIAYTITVTNLGPDDSGTTTLDDVV